MNSKNKYKIGIIIESPYLESWKIESLRKIAENEENELELLIINENSNSGGFYEKSFRKFEQKRCKIITDGLKKNELNLKFKNKINIKLNKKNSFFEFKYEDYKKIIEFDLDVLLSYDYINIDKSIKNDFKLGFWCLDFPEAGFTPGFDEVNNQRSTTKCNFIINSSKFSYPKIFLESYSSTDLLYVIRNQNNMFWKTASFFPRLLKNIHDYGEEKFYDSLKQKNDFKLTQTKNKQKMNFYKFIKALYNHTSKYSKIKKYDSKYWDQFCMLYSQKKELDLEFEKFKPIIPPRDKFWADPQLIVQDKNNHVFFEEFSNLENKGVICTMIINEEGYSEPKKIIEESHHLSYPHVFKFDNQFYMIPESSQKKTIDLYKCEEFPHVWKFKKSLMKNVVATDSTVYYHNKKWWLFSGMAMMEGASSSEELFLFYSDDPTSTEWIPHIQNPISSDVRNARPGGHIFKYNNKLLRPSQNSMKGYGFGINLNEIIELNENMFKEKQINKLEPDWDKKVKAIHTLEYDEGLTIIDARIQVKKI